MGIKLKSASGGGKILAKFANTCLHLPQKTRVAYGGCRFLGLTGFGLRIVRNLGVSGGSGRYLGVQVLGH